MRSVAQAMLREKFPEPVEKMNGHIPDMLIFDEYSATETSENSELSFDSILEEMNKYQDKYLKSPDHLIVPPSIYTELQNMMLDKMKYEVNPTYAIGYDWSTPRIMGMSVETSIVLKSDQMVIRDNKGNIAAQMGKIDDI